MELKPATLNGTAIKTHRPIKGNNISHVGNGTYSGVFELTPEEVAAMGLHESLTSNYKVSLACHTDSHASGMTSPQSVTTNPTSNTEVHILSSEALRDFCRFGLLLALVVLTLTF